MKSIRSAPSSAAMDMSAFSILSNKTTSLFPVCAAYTIGVCPLLNLASTNCLFHERMCWISWTLPNFIHARRMACSCLISPRNWHTSVCAAPVGVNTIGMLQNLRIVYSIVTYSCLCARRYHIDCPLYKHVASVYSVSFQNVKYSFCWYSERYRKRQWILTFGTII